MLNRKASLQDKPAIIKLWKEVFGDSERYVHLFIAGFGIENGYLSEHNHDIVAMAFALPATLLSCEFNTVKGLTIPKRHDLLYIYACATHQDFRRQGIMENLLATIYEEACRENIAGIFLRAKDGSLANYYRKLGFADFFYQNQMSYHRNILSKEIPKSMENGDKFHMISSGTYQNKRVEKLKNEVFISWNESFFLFLNKTGTNYCECNDTIFAFRAEKNRIIVDEFLGTACQEKISGLLFDYLPECEVIHLNSPGNIFCSGQVKWCSASGMKLHNGYFAFGME